MITSPAATVPGTAGQYLADVAAHLSAHGITSHLTRPVGTPVLTAIAPGGSPAPVTVVLHPDPYATADASPGPQLDCTCTCTCTCTWTPAPGATAQATAAVITAVLNAVRQPSQGPARRPPHDGAARLAGFLHRHPGWSVFWDPRYGLWRAAEDDPCSARYAETPDVDAVISYITGCS